jgi:hypothetical protein
MKSKMMSRLLALRRMSEQRALDAFTQRSAAFARADQDARDAGAAAASYAAESQERERKLLEALLGRPVALGEVQTVQSNLDSMSVKALRLRDAEEAAQSVRKERRDELDAAREAFLQRQRATAKLEAVMKSEVARSARRRLALAEATDEDQRGTGGFSKQTGS